MAWYQWFALICLIFCLSVILFHLVRLIRSGSPKDFSFPRGNVALAVAYSMTGAMSPAKKESAYLHLPTYTAGIFYHLGTFLCVVLFFLFLFHVSLASVFSIITGIFLVITGISGLGIFFKRFLKKELRSLSNPDDYISNLLVTVFQLLTACCLFMPGILPFYYIWTGLLLLYIPVGKLRHLLYFFAARYHLGFFYGWRGVWPPKKA